jgi:hypothetical protein
MRIEFITTPGHGHPYKEGDKLDLNGFVEEGYARKYIERGWAKEIPSVAPTPAPSARFDASVAIPIDWAAGKPSDIIALARSLGAKNANSGSAAAAAVTEALFERAVSPVFQTRVNGEERSVVVLQPWPTYIAISADLMGDNASLISGKGNDFTITVENGIANYRIVAEDRTGQKVVALLGEQTYEEAKPVEGQAQ